MVQVGKIGVLDTEIIDSCLMSEESMGMADLYVAKCRDVLADLFVHHYACLMQSVYPSLDLDQHIPVFCEISQMTVIDDC